jgi:hypothetical protein
MIRNVRPLALLIALSTMPQVVAQDTAPYGTLVEAKTRFAFKFFRQTLANAPDTKCPGCPDGSLSGFRTVAKRCRCRGPERNPERFRFP